LPGSWILIALIGCATSAADPEAVDPVVRTRLVLLDPQPKVGGPLRIRIELVNDGPWTVRYNRQQADCNAPLDVVGPDGRPRPYLGGSSSTAGGSERLGPRSSVVIVESLDVASAYLVARPGAYRLRFHGRNLFVSEVHPPADPAGNPDDDLLVRSVVASSDTLPVEVASGPSDDRLTAAERLSAVFPETWTLAWNSDPAEPRFVFRRWTGDKSNSPWISVRIASGGPRSGESREAEWAGRTVYVAAHPGAETLWPAFRTRITEALAGR